MIKNQLCILCELSTKPSFFKTHSSVAQNENCSLKEKHHQKTTRNKAYSEHSTKYTEAALDPDAISYCPIASE